MSKKKKAKKKIEKPVGAVESAPAVRHRPPDGDNEPVGAVEAQTPVVGAQFIAPAVEAAKTEPDTQAPTVGAVVNRPPDGDDTPDTPAPRENRFVASVKRTLARRAKFRAEEKAAKATHKALKKARGRRPLTLLQKVVLAALAVAVVYGVAYFIYYLNHYYFYARYRDFLTTYEVEDGAPYAPLTDAAGDVPGFDLAAENEYLKLYTDPATANVAVFDKRNGQTYYTNPLDAEADSTANNVNIAYLKSQFILTYYNRQVRSGIYDSYSQAVEKGQYEIEALNNGLRYRYRIGELPKVTTGLIPIYLTEELLEEVTARMSESIARQFTRIYISSDIGDDILTVSPVLLANNRRMREVQGWLDEIGWTEDEYYAAMEEVGEIENENVPISFDIALDYRLEGDTLKVSVPVAEIRSYGGGSVYSIQLLRYMGAAGLEENGYMVVPNGSGALINFNNGKQNYPIYQQPIYDMDPLAATYVIMENTESVKLPLFGICREDNSILATVEEGKTLASISAVVSGAFNDYNYAYATFTVGGADNLYLFGATSADVYVKEPEIYDANLTVRYSFLTEDDKGYVGLANYYRDKLVREGKLTPVSETANVASPLAIPFYYDVIGGVKEIKHVLGARYFRTFAMTTYANAAAISDELLAEGINNQVLNYQGWFNGGYYHNTPGNIRLPLSLGSKKELEKLSSQIEDNGGSFYADVAFQQATFADPFVNWQAISSRYYGAGYVAAFGQVDPTTLWRTAGLGYRETAYDLVSPKFLPRYVEQFSKKIGRYDIGGISLRELTSLLYSDKRRTNIINREEALDVVTAQLERLGATDKKLMGNAAFDYSFPYLSDIVNVPTGTNAFFIIDQDIPLYQMIVHGSLNYGSNLLNYRFEEDKTDLILNLIEYGASPHYVFTWENSSRMKNTGMSRFFNTTFSVWKQDAVDTYRLVNAPLQYVTGAMMVDHQILGEGLRAVTYSNGVTIYVNYGAEGVTVDGVTVPARDYTVIAP